MTTTSVPGELLGTRKSDEAYGGQRAGTSVLITNQLGKVLVQHVDYLATCLLPGGAVDKSESPAQAATRELEEELGATTTVDRCLAVDWVSPDSISAPTAMRFPGERRPPRPAPATGQTYVRALATPEQVLELFNWGPSAADQPTAVHRERARLRLPRAPRQPLTLITDNGNII